MKTPTTEIILKKTGCEDITVRCPETVKLSAVETFTVMKCGFAKGLITPADKNLFLPAIIVNIASLLIGLCLLTPFLLFFVVFNLLYFQKFFVRFLQKKLLDGYTLASEEQTELLTKAGVFPLPEKPVVTQNEETSGKTEATTKQVSSFAVNKKMLAVLAGVATVILIFSVATKKSPADKALDRAESVLTKAEKLVGEMKAGGMTQEEFIKKYTETFEELNFDGITVDDKDITAEQKKRLNQLEKRAEKLEHETLQWALSY